MRRRWEGWGTALKPAHEPVCFARKPLSEPTVALNVLRWTTGALNIDGARVAYANDTDHAGAAAAAEARALRAAPGRERWPPFQDPVGALAGWQEKSELGRFPANVVHDGSLEVLEAFPPSARDAIRFFYAAKADKIEREFGLESAPRTKLAGTSLDGIGDPPKVDGERPQARANTHPTVKPVDLMRWLCRLVTPPRGTVLDPFMGSGSTGIAALREGFGFVGIEQSPEYFEIATRRIDAAHAYLQREPDLVHEIGRAVKALGTPRQANLFKEGS